MQGMTSIAPAPLLRPARREQPRRRVAHRPTPASAPRLPLPRAIVWVGRDGSTTRQVDLSWLHWLVLGTLAGLLVISPVWLGWELHGYHGVDGSVAQPRSALADSDREYGRFARLASRTDAPTMGELRRRIATRRARDLGLGTRRVASDLLTGRVAERWSRAAGEKAPVPDTLQWPVREGWFVRGYGSGEDGYHLAVDIAGPLGSPVRAAAGGIVGYAGNGIRGYGRVVMIVHPGGWVTMYAHTRANHVVAGQRVRAGQIVADLGNSGISRGPHVHFEFMHAHKNCDPAPLFRPGVRHRYDNWSSIRKAAWRATEGRPDAIRCAPRRRHPHSRYEMHAKAEQVSDDAI